MLGYQTLSAQNDSIAMKPVSGFTLIELIIVIVVLSILAVGSMSFIGFSARGYVDTALRSKLSSSSAIVNERITQLLRNALPGSLRTTSDQKCIEYIPIIGSTNYTQAPIVGEGLSQTQVLAVPIDGLLQSEGFLAIFPIAAEINDLYSQTQNPGVISTVQATVSGQISGADIFTFNGGATFQFQQHSPTRRLFIVSQPESICQDEARIFWYRNYGFVGDIANLSTNLPTALPDRRILAAEVIEDSVIFSITEASLRRNALVAMELQLSQDGNQMIVTQEIQIRNVP